MTHPRALDPTDGTPAVTVVVGAFSRREYLASAIRSVLEQTLPRSQFEVLVVKNFVDPGTDRRLEQEGVVLRFDEERHVGRWLLAAIRAARSPIVTFLDDDDQYTTERLGRIVDVFRSHPELGYYHNRSLVIDRTGATIPLALWREHEAAALVPDEGWYVPPEEKLIRLRQLVEAEAGFNLSAMALRRDDAIGGLSPLFEAAEHVTDLPTLLVGLLSQRGLFLDGRRLTRYRHHGQNRTMDLGWLDDARADRARIAAAVRQLGAPGYAQWVEDLAAHFEKLVRIDSIAEGIRTRAGRTTVARRAGSYLRFLGHHPMERRPDPLTWGPGLFAGAYLVAPGWTRRLRLARDAQLDRGLRVGGFD